MIPKSFVILILFVGVVLLSMVGCGEDTEKPIVLAEEKTEDSTVEPPVPLLSQEDLHGSWEVVSTFGMTPEQYLESLTEGGETEVEVKQFNYAFAADNSWTGNFASETAYIFPDIPPGNLKLTGTWSGTYVFDGLTLSIVAEGADTHVETEPQDFFQVVVGQTIEEAEQTFDESFRSDFLKPFERSTCTKHGQMLILISPAGKKMVLEKQ